MIARFAATATPVLGGTVAGVTRTVSSVWLAGSTESGVAMPSPEGCVGSPPHELAGARLLRGIGPVATKSALLLSVSWQPLPRRMAALVLSRPGAEAFASAQFADPYPTRSTNV